MSLPITFLTLIAAAVAALVFSTLTYSLREISRAKLGERLERRGKGKLLDATMDHIDDFVFVTAFGRLVSNITVLMLTLGLIDETPYRPIVRYLITAIIASIIHLISSVVIPNTLANYAGDTIVASSIELLMGLRAALLPLTKLVGLFDDFIRRTTGATDAPEAEEIEQEILSVVEEGEKEGVVDEDERKMIESIIRFRTTTIGQIMTARPEIFGLPIDANLTQVKQIIEESGHSRMPVYEGSLDNIKGVLYSRDLLHMLGEPPQRLNIRALIRPPYFVPESKPLRDLLDDFRLQKVHIAIVLDEYGGTAGLVTIEDLLEELVGDISDEHEPIAPAMFKRLDDLSAEADARIYIDELNRLLGLNLPEDEGYDTLGGFVTTTLGRIPETGATFDSHNVRFLILDAEPQKVNRLKVEVLPLPPEGEVVTDPPVGALESAAEKVG